MATPFMDIRIQVARDEITVAYARIRKAWRTIKSSRAFLAKRIPERNQLIQQAYDEDMPIDELAEHAGLHRTEIVNIVARNEWVDTVDPVGGYSDKQAQASDSLEILIPGIVEVVKQLRSGSLPDGHAYALAYELRYRMGKVVAGLGAGLPGPQTRYWAKRIVGSEVAQ